MSDSERKLFPIETVIALVNGKQDVDLKPLAGYIVGRSLPCDTMVSAVAPFAAAWLVRLYPAMAEILWNEKDGSWPVFVDRCSYILGNRVSLPPMGGNLKAACAAVLDAMVANADEVKALKKEIESLSAEVAALKPLEGKLKEAQTRADKLDDQLKAAKKDMSALRRQTIAFEGKIAVNEQDLQELIKSAIKANLKTIKLAAPAAAAAGAAVAGAAPAAAAAGDEFGFGPNAGDEFGLGPSIGGGFGFDDMSAEGSAPEPSGDEFGLGPSTGQDEFGL